MNHTITKSIELPHLDLYLQTLTPSTAKVYRNVLFKFREYLNSIQVQIQNVRLSHLQLYRMELRKRLASLTCNKELSAIKAYFKWLLIHGAISRNPAEGIVLFPTSDYVPTEALEPHEAQSILSSIRTNSEAGILHSAIMHTLLFTGIRCAELCDIQTKDLGAEGGIPTITIHGKGGKKRVLPLPDEAFQAIRLYMEFLYVQKNTREAGDPLFQSTQTPGKPIHKNTVRNIVKKYAEKAGIKKRISPHSCRATAVSNALENGASVTAVQHMGGWSSMNMVLRYDRHRLMLKNSAVKHIKYRR